MDQGKGYCVVCKEALTISEAKEVVMKNGRKALKGKCPKCGRNLYRILAGK